MVRAKFDCRQSSPEGVVILEPVYSGSKENEEFFKATPGGQVTLTIANPDVASKFVEGRSYYLDFFEENEAPAVAPVPVAAPVVSDDVDPMDGVSPEQFEKEKILRFFRNAHLPEPLRALSRKFAALAVHVAAAADPSAERTVALRKLLEGKDAAVRAILPPK